MIEDIQKINKLAQELLDQGIATDRESAVKKAEEMLNKKIQNQQPVSENKVEANKEEHNGLEYYKNMISRTKEQMERQLSVFTQKMNEMIKEINEIKEQLNTRATSKTASDAGINSEKPLKEAVEEKPKQEKQEKLEKDKPHPKRGNWQSEDVCIEKMFYFGNK